MVNILFDKTKKRFHITNDSISYIISVLDNGHISHDYFGECISLEQDEFFWVHQHRPLTTYNEDGMSLQNHKLEYPCSRNSDYRNSAIEVEFIDGSSIIDFEYVGHEILNGKTELIELPCSRSSKDAKTLLITLVDASSKLKLVLKYTIYDELNSVVRSSEIINEGSDLVTLQKALSLSIDLNTNYNKWIQLSGDWARERHVIERKLDYGRTIVESLTGNSSAYHNPFIMLLEEETSEDIGNSISVALIYSGNHMISSEVNSVGINRIQAGIHPETFRWLLNPNDRFQTPETVLTYSNEGKNGNSIALHRFINKHIIDTKWLDEPRPLLINNWEATYFDFDDETLYSIAKSASELGFNLFVLDDGWFGKRNSDKQGLGDWYVNTSKLKDGLKPLVEKINSLGMDFGIWIEPEMVNTDSELFRRHPDWVVGYSKRSLSTGRNQLILDFSNPIVVENIFNQLISVFDNINLKYIKWDMNRNMTEQYSSFLTPEQQGEFSHRYMLGVYDLYSRLVKRYPKVMIEGCASGGNRFDLGILYYSPQIWTSDNTDGYERVKIQYGTSYGYPLSTISSHVSTVPNHQVMRSTSLKYRSDVATFGTYGYELDPRTLSKEEKIFVKKENAEYLKRQKLILTGDFYRMESPFKSNVTSWITVSHDKSEAIAGYYYSLSEPNKGPIRLMFKGLEKVFKYKVSSILFEGIVSGSYLMNNGIVVKPSFNGVEKVRDIVGDFQSYLVELKKV